MSYNYLIKMVIGIKSDYHLFVYMIESIYIFATYKILVNVQINLFINLII